MNRSIWCGVIWGCVSLIAPAAPAQDDEKAEAQRQEAVARQQAAEAKQLKAVVDELQAKLQQARDEVQQALEQRDAKHEIAELQEQLKAAREEAERARAAAEEQRQRFERAMTEAKKYAHALIQERDRAADAEVVARQRAANEVQRLGQLERDRNAAAQEALRHRLADLVEQLKRDPNSPETQARTAQLKELQATLAAATQVEAAKAPEGGEGGLRHLINAANQALARAHEEQRLAGMIQQLRGLGRHEEAARLEAKARELGLALADQPQQTPEQSKMAPKPGDAFAGEMPQGEMMQRMAQRMRAIQEAGGAGGIRQAIEELRGEVRQLREEVQGLRKLLETKPDANQGAKDAFDRGAINDAGKPEDLFRIRSRVAGEVPDRSRRSHAPASRGRPGTQGRSLGGRLLQRD